MRSTILCLQQYLELGMPSKIQFKKTIISDQVHHQLFPRACYKSFWMSLILGMSFATDLMANESIQTVESSEQQKLNQQHNIAPQPKDETDSVALLEEQQQGQADLFRPIEFDELENIEIAPVDPTLAAEIYKAADEAKLDADALERKPLEQLQVNIPDLSPQEMADLARAPVDVDQLMNRIQTDSSVVVESTDQSQAANNALKELGLTSPEVENTEKSGFIQRIRQRFSPDKDRPVAIAKISSVVEGAPTALANNIKAKLSTYTVESFSDFNSAIPQLRQLSQEAAQALGYYDASFKFERVNQERVKVLVRPGETVKVKSQEIEYIGAGARLPQLQLIRVLPDLTEGDDFNHGEYEQTKSRIVEAAANNGFFDSFWRLHDAKVSLPENTADINLRFETGERYKLGEVEFRMSDPSKPLPIKLEILKTLAPWRDGADYTAWRVNALANNLTNSRYFNYTLVDAVKPDPIIQPLDLAPDLQALVDEQKVTEAEILASRGETALAAQTRMQAADSPQDNKEVTQTLVDEKQFAGADGVQVAQRMHQDHQQSEKELELERLKDQARADKIIPVIVTLNADRLNSLETGIGYGTDTGVRARAQYRRAIVNQYGHSFDANMEISQIRQSIDGRYNIPYKHPLNDYISLVGGYEREERDGVGPDMNLVIESAVLGADRIIKGSRNDWQHVFGLRYRLDRLTQHGIVENVPDQFLIPGSQPEQEALLVGYEVSKTTSDNRVNPTRGFKQSYKVELGSDALLSSTDIAMVNANWKLLYSMGENNDHQFLAGTQLGYIYTPDFDKVPYNLRYFAGGDQSMRGFDYKSLSPEQYGYKVGGQALAVGTLEYNYQFKDGWRAAIFSDFGNAYNEKFTNPTEYSVGVGIRWRSPIGPIRLDVASGISDEGRPIRLHFFIGSQL